MEKNVCIIHFNTPELTRATIRSVWKHTPDCRITVFDNSDSIPFGKMDGVLVLDNTRGQLLDFDKFLSRYPRRRPSKNGWASAKHAKTVDCLFSLFPDGFVLMDSDILVRKDITGLFDDRCLFVGKIKEGGCGINNCNSRLLPFLCWLNVKMCSDNDIHFFDGSRSWKLNYGGPGTWYDTGGSFLQDCIRSGLPVRYVDIDDYMIHFYGGSYKNKDWRAWLDQHRELYE